MRYFSAPIEQLGRIYHFHHRKNIVDNIDYFAYHHHVFCEIYLLCNGDAEFIIEDSIYPLEKDDILVIPPYKIHSTKPKPGTNLERIVLNIFPSFFAEMLCPNYIDVISRFSETGHLIKNNIGRAYMLQDLLHSLDQSFNNDYNASNILPNLKIVELIYNITEICGSCDDINTWIYQDNKTGVYVREAHIDSVNATDKKTEIIQITDVHLNYTDEDDEDDEEVMYTKECRKWNADGISVKALVNAMEYAKGHDRTVITGDTLDYLTNGSMKLMQKYIWDEDPECIVTLGGHDITKQMQTKRPDKLPLSQRQAIVQEFWKHDIFYSSEILNDNVMIVQMDNSCGCYWESQIPKLEKDLQTARSNGYTVLIFQHEAISTGRKEDKEYKAFYVWADCADTENFYDKCVGNKPDSDEASIEVYKIITENADIIRGLFCGHYHTSYYMDIEGSYIDEKGIRKRRTIPQYVLEVTSKNS